MKTYIELDKQDLEALQRVAPLLSHSKYLTNNEEVKRILKDLANDFYVLGDAELHKDGFLDCSFIYFDASLINKNLRYTDVV